MSNLLLNLYNRSVNQYRKFSQRLQKRSVTSASTARQKYHHWKLQQKARKYHRQSSQLAFQLKIAAAAGIATAVAADSNEAQGQGLGPFTNVNRLQNPLRAPLQIYSYNMVGHALGDIDQDGDVDLLVGYYDDNVGAGYIKTFKNFQVEYASSKPVFMEVPNGALPYTISNSDATFVASFVDLDGDGLEELAIAVGYYEAVEFLQNDNNGTGNFSLIGVNPPGLYIDPNYYTSSLVSVDIDNDGDLDLMSGTSWSSSGIRFWRNDGTNTFALTAHNENDNGMKYASPAFIDIDNDGDQDMFVGDDSGVVHFFLNQESGGVNINPNNFLQDDANPLNFLNGIDFGSYAMPRFIDLDLDGDQDLVLSKRKNNFNPSNGYLHVFYNDGANNFTEAIGLDNPFGGVPGPGPYLQDGHSNITFGDIDNDGDNDVMYGGYYGYVYFYENVNGAFVSRLGAGNPAGFTGGIGDTYTYPTLSDIDGDGDLDLLVGSSYGLYLYLNNGTPSVPNISSAATPFSAGTFISGGSIFDTVQPDLVDFDVDGDQDMFITGMYNPSGYGLLYDNLGPPAALNFAGGAYVNATSSYRNNLEAADMDHDGDYDLIIGTASGGNLDISINAGGIWSPIGTNPFASFNASPESPANRAAPEAIDWDGDGDLDLFVGREDGTINFLRNDNAPVTVGVGADITYTENAGPVPGLPVTLTDPDAIPNTTIVRAFIKMNGFIDTEDQLNFTNQFNIAGTFNSTGDELTLTGSDSFANYVTAISSLTYENTSENPDATPRVVEYQVWDSDYTNPNTYSGTINVQPVNDAPSITIASGTLDYMENQGILPIAPAFSASDIDNTSLQGATIAVTGGYQDGKDFLRFTDQNGITGVFAAGVLTLSGLATVSDYITAVQSVGFENMSDDPVSVPRVITFSVTDGAASSKERPRSVNIKAMNDAPVVTSSTGNIAVRSLENPVIIDDQLMISDADNTTLNGATVTVSGNYAPEEDILGFTNQNGITSTFSQNLGILSLSGAASVADYQTALQSVTYANTAPTPTSAQKTISFVVSDSKLGSSAATRTVDVSPNVVATVDIAAEVTANGSVTIDLVSQATFDPGDNVVVHLLGTPFKGTAVVNADQTVTYTANANAWGSETIPYEICNQWGSCGEANLTMQINNTPPEIDQTAPIKTGAKSVLSAPFDSFLSVVDLEDNLNPNTLAITQQPSSGSPATIEGENLVVDYTNSSFTGVDRLMISVCDYSGECSEFEVVIVVGELERVNVFNAVSPNNDGFHDFLHIEDIEFFQSNTVYVYDKNGRLVFDMEDYNNVDRVFIGQNNKGDDLPNGTYYYAIFLTSPEGNDYKQSGFFVLQK